MAEVEAIPVTEFSVHVELGRCTATDRDSIADPSARPTSFDSLPDRMGTSVSLRRNVELSTAMRDWIVARQLDGVALPHDVHLTMRDVEGRVVSRWCLRHAAVARVDGVGFGAVAANGTNGDELVDLAIDELVLTCERIDLEPAQ